jgi:hypothetical protein
MTTTPKNLIQAIENGLSDIQSEPESGFSSDIIRSHIQDYLAQKFTIAFSEADDDKTVQLIQRLWQNIIK